MLRKPRPFHKVTLMNFLTLSEPEQDDVQGNKLAGVSIVKLVIGPLEEHLDFVPGSEFIFTWKFH